jgi:hypothetical protein
VAITFTSAQAGASTATSGAGLTPASGSYAAGSVLIAHAFYQDLVTVPGTPSGWTLLFGPANVGTTAVGRHWAFGRIATGTDTCAFGTAGGTNKRSARIYGFGGRTSGTISQVCPAVSFSDIPHATDPAMPTVTTTETGALAVALIAQHDDNAAAAATGATGGTWAEAVAEYLEAVIGAVDTMMQIQTCTPTANPGTVSGGTVATANDPAGTIGFEIRTQPTAGPTETRPGLTIGPSKAVFRAATW